MQKPCRRSKLSNDDISSHEFDSALYFARKEACFRLPHFCSISVLEESDIRPRRRYVHTPSWKSQFNKWSMAHGWDINAYISSPFLTNVFRKYLPGSSKDGNSTHLLEYGLHVNSFKDWGWQDHDSYRVLHNWPSQGTNLWCLINSAGISPNLHQLFSRGK